MDFGLGQDAQYPRAENGADSMMVFVKTKRLAVDESSSEN